MNNRHIDCNVLCHLGNIGLLVLLISGPNRLNLISTLYKVRDSHSSSLLKCEPIGLDNISSLLFVIGCFPRSQKFAV